MPDPIQLNLVECGRIERSHYILTMAIWTHPDWCEYFQPFVIILALVQINYNLKAESVYSTQSDSINSAESNDL
jgi:hypothetical protein